VRTIFNITIVGLFTCLVIVFCISGCSGKKVDPRPITLEELKQFNGKAGQPAYVAIEGKVYDITRCKYWKEGEHTTTQQLAIAGEDLSDIIGESKHGVKRLMKYPLVGYIVSNKE